MADCHAEWVGDVATRLRITDVDTLGGRKAPLTWPWYPAADGDPTSRRGDSQSDLSRHDEEAVLPD
ncbi:hypothetical protein EV648_102408 [Kribbella sp. VKM Ac-2568]|nr:hypothetical protein EV648_102408 [Kribbella sp. VKM Ac-2568]